MFQPISSIYLPPIEEISYMPTRTVKNLKFIEDFELTTKKFDQATTAPKTRTALEIYKNEATHTFVSTSIPALDVALGGGLVIGQITEFCGAPGSGKTQLCFQISADYLVSKLQPDQHGKFKEIIYVSTNHNFALHRLREIICRKLEAGNNESVIENILKCIHVIKVTDATEFLALGKYLEKWILEHNVGILLVDNICMPLKSLNGTERVQIIFKVLLQLQILATQYGFPIVLTNSLTTRTKTTMDTNMRPVSLGDAYYHRINTRIKLSRNIFGSFKATIVKCVHSRQQDIEFCIS